MNVYRKLIRYLARKEIALARAEGRLEGALKSFGERANALTERLNGFADGMEAALGLMESQVRQRTGSDDLSQATADDVKAVRRRSVH